MKKRTKSHNLLTRINEMQFLDTNPTSKDYFRVKLPEKFMVGKNQITIQPTDNLLKGSPILIDIYDDKNNLIYYEVTNVIDHDNSRIIAVYIYPNTQYGNIKVYIAGTVNRVVGSMIRPDTRTENIGWKVLVPFSDEAVKNKPLYNAFPTANVTEILQPLYTQVIARLVTLKPSTEKINVLSPQFQRIGRTYDPLVRLNNLSFQEISSTSNTVTGSRPGINSEFNITSSAVVTSGNGAFINTLNSDIISVNEPFFNSMMVGGTISFNPISYLESNIKEYPNLTSGDLKPFDRLFSASIIEVVNRFTVKTLPNFFIDVSGSYVNKVYNINNFTCSYYGVPDVDTKPSSKHVNQSYLLFEFMGISPVVGNCNLLDIEYKPYYTSGQKVVIENVGVESSEFLCDFNRPEINGTFHKIGFPTTPTDITKYWNVFRSSGVSSSSLPVTQFDIDGVIAPSYSKIINATDWVRLTTTGSYDFVAANHTTYNVTFDYEVIKNQDVFQTPQVDVYMSGSSVTHDNITKYIQPPLNIQNVGTYIGSATANGRFGRFDKSFTSNSKNEKVKLNIIIRSGQWKFSKISIKSESTKGFNPNHIYTMIPTPDGVNYSELEFNIKYKNNNLESNVNTTLKGLMMSGSSKDL